jgi:hypothetical protein
VVRSSAGLAIALALGAVLAACGGSGHPASTATVTTVASTAASTVALAPPDDPVGRALQQLSVQLGTGLGKFRHDFAASGRSRSLAQRQALLKKLSSEFGGADQSIAKASAASPLGGQASGLDALRGVTQPVAAFLATSTKATTPEQMTGVYCDLKALDRLHRTVIAAEQHVNTQAQQLGAPAAPLVVDKPSRGAWSVAMAAGCFGVIRDQFTALSQASKSKQATKAAVTADQIRAAMLGLRAGLAPARSSDNAPAVRTAAASLQQLAALEATYMALVARSWRHGSVSQSRRKALEKQIPNAFKQATARVKSSGALNF